jgi:ATP-dependent Clp protease ATP-binding subunit ClpC
MSRARKIRRRLGHQRMLPHHVLLAILEEGRNIPVRVLKELNVDIKAAVEQLQQELHHKTPALFAADNETPLGRFARKVICTKHFPDAIPFAGREEELQRAVDLIAGEGKCIIIAGRPGVGKTAFVRELEGRLTRAFSDIGCAYGGLYELKIAYLFSEITDQEELAVNLLDLLSTIVGTHAILFIEGIDLFFGLDARTRAGFFANTVLDFIRNNKLLVVATTSPEGMSSCETEPSGDISIFETIHLSEPPHDLMLNILTSAKDVFETKYSLHMEDEALSTALELSERLPVSAFPGKTLEFLEHACLLAKITGEPGEEIHLDSRLVKQLSNVIPNVKQRLGSEEILDDGFAKELG